jgi:aspartate kinase
VLFLARFVVKLGGSVLSDLAGVERAAAYIHKLVESGDRVVVVVSALKGVTDELLKTVNTLHPSPPPDMVDNTLAMGEMMSARYFALALHRLGVQAAVVDPCTDIWPVVTDDRHLDANPLLEECRELTKQGLERLLEKGVVPVVCGFIGVSKYGRITTMGRGGSDTTAVLLANCLDADEVILVKDVSGVYTADPKKTTEANVIDVISAEEVLTLSRGGAKVIHAKALQFLSPKSKIRVGTLESLEAGGTVIFGSEIPSLDVRVDNTNVTMVTLVGSSMGDVSKLSGVVKALEAASAKVIASSVEESSLILYLDGDGEVVEKLHDYFVGHRLGKAVSHFPHLSLIRVYGSMLETVPGVVHKVLQPLAANSINVFGVLTISSSIRVFVSTRDVEKSVKLIRESLREYLGEQVRSQGVG